MIKKIKNIKWSESKNQEEVKWIEPQTDEVIEPYGYVILAFIP